VDAGRPHRVGGDAAATAALQIQLVAGISHHRLASVNKLSACADTDLLCMALYLPHALLHALANTAFRETGEIHPHAEMYL
jgi:hypothetical protein